MKLNEVLNFDKIKRNDPITQIAQAHKINPVLAQVLFAKGVKVETQLHKHDRQQATKIAMQNLLQDVEYYEDYKF